MISHPLDMLPERPSLLIACAPASAGDIERILREQVTGPLWPDAIGAVQLVAHQQDPDVLSAIRGRAYISPPFVAYLTESRTGGGRILAHRGVAHLPALECDSHATWWPAVSVRRSHADGAFVIRDEDTATAIQMCTVLEDLLAGFGIAALPPLQPK